MADELKKFGKYFLLDHMTQGGFADIYRARLATPEGASRIIVIKRIQAGYDANSEFIQMFRSETKTSMALNHPNIVQVFDVGEEQGQPYIAMELVHGRNLRQILTRFGEQQKNLPVFLAAHIIEQAARALAYAHEFRDNLTGQALNLVHRDISPQNIMVSYEGNVKLIDFGIAKATTNSEHTRTGVIKGKPSYFSPEQINGDDVGAAHRPKTFRRRKRYRHYQDDRGMQLQGRPTIQVQCADSKGPG
jgi:serine/threonine-protein kinase